MVRWLEKGVLLARVSAWLCALLPLQGQERRQRSEKGNQMERRELELIAAAEMADVSRVRTLLEQGVSPNVANEDGVTGLNVAASKGCVECLRLLLDAGADVNSANIDGMTPLMEACAERTATAVVELLIKEGADVNARMSEIGWTSLMRATVGLNVEIVKLLLAAGADVAARNSDGESALTLLDKLFADLASEVKDASLPPGFRKVAENRERRRAEIRGLLKRERSVP